MQSAPKFHIIPFVASLLICLFACNLSADTPPIRVSVDVIGENGNDARMLSALSREFRKLDGVLVTDTQPTLKISCSVIRETAEQGKVTTGYACSIAVTDADGRLIVHNIVTHTSIDTLAHEVAISLDGTVIEHVRRASQPPKSP